MIASSYAATLAALRLDLPVHPHPPVTTVEEARAHWAAISATHTKNLLLKDDARRFWLVVVQAETTLDLKALPAAIGSKRLRFASADDLGRLLGVTTGAVSPLALINDRDGEVTLAVERELLAASLLAFHPLRNDATVTIAPADLTRYLTSVDHPAAVFDTPVNSQTLS